MTDLASLQIRVQSLEAEVADRRLKGLTKSGRQAERATDGLMSTMKRFAGPAAVAAAAVASLTKIVNVTREFEVLNAQLITATGSADNAAVAFEAIQDFATQTPYDLQQVTEGFTKLVNLGLTPSEKALTSYGDTASAMGKDLNQLIEAVADAATGEFERLKEFGIKAKSQGDQVSFTFRGVTTTVGKNAAEIEQYLIGLGENNFAGAMAERMNTLDGAISNLGDEWNKLWLNISQQGIGSVIEDSIRLAIDGLAELNAMISSGQLGAYLDAIANKFSGFGDDAAGVMSLITDLWEQVPAEWKELAVQAVDFIIDAFVNLPENLRATVRLMAVELASLIDYGKAFGAALVEVIVAKFEELVAKAGAYGTAIGEAINPFSDGDFNLEAEIARIEGEFEKSADAAWDTARKQADRTAAIRRASIGDILEERDAAVEAFDAQINKADELRAAYEKEQAAKREAGGDRLAGFGQGPAAENGPTDAERKAAEKAQKEAERKAAVQQKAFDDLVASLRTEEEAIQESYDRRLAIILANTEEGSIQQQELKQRLDEQFADEAIGDLNQVDTYEEQLAELETYYQNRMDLILNNTALTEQQRTELETKLTKQRNDRLAQLESTRMSAIFQSSSQLFDGLAGIAKSFGGEQSKAYKVMFAASKAFAIADAVVKIQQGIAAAAATPWPANIAAIASTVAATAGVLSTIQSTTMQLSGAYDEGGNIPAGKVGIVGEYGPELVNGPASVTSRKKTEDLLGQGMAGQTGSVTVNIINNADGTTASATETETADGKLVEVVIERTKREIAREFREGGGVVNRAAENAYGLRRGVA